MTLNAREHVTDAAANTLENHNEPIRSKYTINATFAPVATDGTVLSVCTPVGFNSTLGQFAAWMAPDPTTVVVNLSGASAGTWTLTVNGITTDTLTYAATAAQVLNALRDIGFIVTVTKVSDVVTITFDDDVDILTPPTVTESDADFNGNNGESYSVAEGTEIVPDPSTLTLDLGGADGGTFTITVDDETTANIAYNADKAAIEAALLAIGVTATATVAATILISFGDYAQLIALPVATATFTNLTNAVSPTAVLDPGTEIVPDPTVLTITLGTVSGGTFTITVDGTETSALAYNISAANLVTALGVAGVVATDVLAAGVHSITFGALAQLVSLPVITADLADLTGTFVTITAGTTTYGTHKIRGFVSPEPITLSDTETIIGTVCVDGEIAYSAAAALVAVGDVTALQTALKDCLIPGLVVQGLPGIH